MSVSHKSLNTPAFRMMLYRRPLHPELFDLQGRRTDRHGEYEIESWLTPAGHVVRFAVENQQMTETVIDSGNHLPETGLVHALPCLGEKDFEMEPEGRFGYFTTIQTETLTDNLYQATLREMQEFAHETGSLHHRWDTDYGTNLSVLDAQKYKREYHVQSYHLVASNGTVLRTQSIFEIKK
ncbi:MAG: DUF2617 family protein [Planctomycetota bacterium]